MNALAQLAEQTAFEPEPNPLNKPELDLVAGEMQRRVGRTLEVTKFYEPFADRSNPRAESSNQLSDFETMSVQSRINGAIAAARPIPRRPTLLSLQPLQEWEGYVAEIDEEKFTARLLDLTAGGKYEEEIADFPISDLSDTDVDLLKPGAVFRWVIGYQRQLGGTKRRVSQITFRRLPAWSKKDLMNAARKADAIAQDIDWV